MAFIAEMLDVLVRVTIKVNSNPKKPPRFGPPFHYPRPHERDEVTGAPVQPKSPQELFMESMRNARPSRGE